MVKENISKEKWIKDVEYIGKNLPRKHKNLFFQMSKENFDNEISELIEDIPTLESNEIQVRILKILSKVGDSHTTVVNFRSGKVLPIGFYIFSDGPHITITKDKKYEDLLGIKILSINDIPIDKIIKDAGEYIPY